MIALTVNGKPVQLEASLLLVEYLRALGIDPRAIAVEINGGIVARDRYGSHTLQDGDRVEIVRMVGGGSVDSLPPLRRVVRVDRGDRTTESRGTRRRTEKFF
jgi:sulfur carrier protein